MVMLTTGSARCWVLQFSGIKSFRRVNGQVDPFDDHGYDLRDFVERSVRVCAVVGITGYSARFRTAEGLMSAFVTSNKLRATKSLLRMCTRKSPLPWSLLQNS